MESQWHVILAAEGRQALFPTEAALRRAVLELGRVAGSYILLFCLVDEHIHAVVSCDRQRAGRVARAIQLGLRPVAAAPIKTRAEIRPVENRFHMERLVGYLVGQPTHHGLRCHPALWSGSCLPDLIGARMAGALGKPLAPVLPRFRIGQVTASVGLGARQIVACDDGRIRSLGAAALAAAAAAALATDPKLEGEAAEVVSARAATAVLARSAGMATREIAFALRVTPRAVQRLAGKRPDPAILHAVRMRLALEDAVAAAGSAAPGVAPLTAPGKDR